MNIFVYDCEVTAYDNLVCIKKYDQDEWYIFHNDGWGLNEFLEDHEDDIFFGFNSKNYDQFIVRSIATTNDPEEVKALNDFIIDGYSGWDYPNLEYIRFHNADIMDDMQMGQSLKSIEAHMGMNIHETTVDFDIDRPWTPDEYCRMEFYCKHDVKATEQIIKMRKEYLNNKIEVGKLAGLDALQSLCRTNAKLTAAALHAEAHEDRGDVRNYVIPGQVRKEFVPKKILEFFDKLKDESIPDSTVFSSKCELSIGDCPTTVGWGGIHGALPNFIWDSKKDREYKIINLDVGSYYPHLIVLYNYISRNVSDPSLYVQILNKRMQAKKDGNKELANALKLVLNTTYGGTLNQYNPLHDPLMARSVCISGQLFLSELANHLAQDVEDLSIVQLNTDGIMIKYRKGDQDNVDTITKEWCERTGFDLETDEVVKIIQKDVSNYIEVQPDGNYKIKGSWLVRGREQAGGFKLNNNDRIIPEAIIKYFVDGVPVEKTIGDCDDPLMFQYVSKAGSKFKECYQLINDEKIPRQKVNRVFASPNTSLGTLYKVHGTTGQINKIEGLPEHCLVHNLDSPPDISEIDKQFYIDKAKTMIEAFIEGKKETKGKRKMAATKTAKSVGKKLIEARHRFHQERVQPSGYNDSKLDYEYFELKDIVPLATEIFNELGLVPIIQIGRKKAKMTIYDTDGISEPLVLSVPVSEAEQIISSTGKAVTSAIQAMGSTITYYRRYLWMVAMDVCVQDEVDATETAVKRDAVSKAPATPQARMETKAELTAPKDNADELQLAALKKVINELITKNPEQKKFAIDIANKTKKFTEISRADCDELIKTVKGMLADGKDSE